MLKELLIIENYGIHNCIFKMVMFLKEDIKMRMAIM